jgi:transposase
MKEQQKYEVIKELVGHGGNKRRAALTLGCSKRSVDRYIAGYKAEGKAYFLHGNRGRSPANALNEALKRDIIDFYTSKYYDANFTHFTELLAERENIFISAGSVRKILKEEDILSPLANRKTRRGLKKKLEAKLKRVTSKKQAEEIKVKIIEADDPHPRRPRCSRFGEMIQMDASLHLWFGDTKATLHLAVDDSTGVIVGAWFEEQETLAGYYHVFEQILVNYGIPYMFYTDRRTVFEYKKSGGDTSNDTFTQFSYACKQFGVQIKTTSIPQAKGRIEKLNGSLQSRLPVELRLEGVATIEQANEYLARFIVSYNARFALEPNFTTSVFETQPSREKIDLTLAVIAERTVDTGHSIRFGNKYFMTLNRDGIPFYLRKGVKGLVIQSFSDLLFFSAEENIFALEEIPEHERVSRNFDSIIPAEKPKKRYIPPANHPWRLQAFSSFIRKQPHRTA